MTISLPLKPLVAAMSGVRRKAMMGAAATALIAVAPVLHAAEPVVQARTVQAAVRSILSAPLPKIGAFGALQLPPVGVSSIVISNEDDITVGDGETALGHVSDQDDISLVNTGDLTGGIGIDVATGAVDLDSAVIDGTVTRTSSWTSEPLFDDAGNRVYACDSYCVPQYGVTGELNVNARYTYLPSDPLDSTISVDNRGSIAFAGRHAIRATNPAGQSIDIVNSGDIAATQDTAFRSGIYASTEAYSITFGEITQTATGEVTRNANGQLTGVIAPDEYSLDYHQVDMEHDGGAIAVHNTGDIDMGVTTVAPYFGSPSIKASAGIYTRGDGGTTIVNEGDITVDKWSSGIHVSSTATTSISNSGRIDIGNASSGISFGPSIAPYSYVDDYRLGGDVYILNTGDIRGGITKAEAAPYEAVYAYGISVLSLGSNQETYAARAHINEIYAGYNELLGEEAFPLFDIPNARLYDTTAVNRGHIELGDGARGISILPMAGDSTAINEGTIIVGDGTSTRFNSSNQSAGIFQSNHNFDGWGSTTSVNGETGIIVTGDDSAGIMNVNFFGTAVAVNLGSITTGNGLSRQYALYGGGTYDRLFLSYGIWNSSSAPGFGATSTAHNSGDITVGDLAVGMMVSGQGSPRLDPAAMTAINENLGIIATGDDSSGMFTQGTNATSFNGGSITTGSSNLEVFHPNPNYGDFRLASLGFGVASSGNVLAEVINYGTIATGNGTVGAAAMISDYSFGYAARLLQNQDGVITTGDDSIGAMVEGNYAAVLVNEGRVSVGNDSVGADLSAGSVVLFYGDVTATVVDGAVFATNNGIVETGDNSVGVRLNAVHEDVPYAGRVDVRDPPGCSPFYDPNCTITTVYVSGTADSIGTAYLANSGTIRVGANSTGVEITGEAANEQGLQLVNAGTIAAGSGTAIRLNAGNDIDSYLLNGGQITGDIVFGAGDDRLMNRQFVNDFGQLVSTGNITLYNSTIDFGAGSNRFDNDRGVITVAGGDNLITGADLFMTQASIEARNDVVGSRLTIDGNLSGSFTFGTDISSVGADQLVITGDVADGSSMGLVLNPTEQFRGERDFAVISVGGQNGADAPVVAGVGGRFADSLLGAEARFDEASGEVLVTATFGMGHMATAAASTTTMAQNWWMQSVGNYKQRNLHQLAGVNDTGLSVWGTAFHEEGTIKPDNALQSTSFDQKLSGLQTGIQWMQDLGGGSFSVSPMFSYGDARASLNANLGSATGDAMAYGLNANYTLENGLYFDATWQKSTMEVDFRTPGTVSNARGEADADGDGFNVEMGYAHKLKSGLTLAPQVQYGDVKVDLDDFASSDGTYDFSDVGGRYSLLRAGMSVFKTFETKNGSITPLADLNYLYATEGDSELFSNGVWFANDTTGSGYSAEFGLAGRYKDWDISGRVGLSDASASDHVLLTNLTVRYRW